MKPDYRERFLRSMGILSQSQLEKIQKTSIGIAGLGLGGSVFINLVRLGFQKFHIADPDTFERTNINRQRLAKETTIGRRKDDCVMEEARAINPDVQIQAFPEGVKPENMAEFLNGLDWVVDIVDVFALPDKIALHQEARKLKIPVASCATLGFSGSVVIFNHETPSFDELTGMSADMHFMENLERFLQFICPEIPDYMLDQMIKAMDRSTHIPFVVPGGEISAAFCATEIAKNLMGAGKRAYAPTGVFADAFNLKVELFRADHRARKLPAHWAKKAA
jgi:molybdopterin/thiamine biosynthesis adenylyltransferase